MSIVESQTSHSAVDTTTIWTRVTESLWVASAHDEFLGMVEAVGDRYRASDRRGILIAEAADLDGGKRQVLHPGGRAYDRRRRSEPEPADLHLALATAVIAGVVCAASLVMLLTGLGS